MIFQVQETKAELNVLGDGIEEVRSICRQLHTHLRQIPECTIIPFDSEADALMDRWLDVSLVTLNSQLTIFPLFPKSINLLFLFPMHIML